MRVTIWRMLLLLAALAAAPGSLRAEEPTAEVDNPEYAAWSACKPGTWVKFIQETELNGLKTKIEKTIALKELAPDKVVLESFLSMEAAGQKGTAAPSRREVPAKVAKPEAPKPDEPKSSAPREDREELEIAGKKLACKTMLLKASSGDAASTSKTWLCDEVPGRLVKSELTSKAMRSTLLLMAFEKK